MSEQQTLEQQKCPSEAGRIIPVVDRNRCEAKSDCVTVCPYDVFEVRKLTATESQDLGFISKIRLFVHGGKQAFAVRSTDCHACGLCVKACPEKAIKLVNIEKSSPVQ
jgi:NAD-dependent dihydropyrimidine dehydrogenase PreA subunit